MRGQDRGKSSSTDNMSIVYNNTNYSNTMNRSITQCVLLLVVLSLNK